MYNINVLGKAKSLCTVFLLTNGKNGTLLPLLYVSSIQSLIVEKYSIKYRPIGLEIFTSNDSSEDKAKMLL